MTDHETIVPATRIEQKIIFLRGHKVMLDADLAELYGVETKVLNQAVRRNQQRFPADFMFELSAEEHACLRSQSVTSNKRGGRRYRPYAFTEEGVAMLSSVLRSETAIQVNIEIMRAFARLRHILASHRELAQKLSELERKYDKAFAVVFEALKELMTPALPERKGKVGSRSPGREDGKQEDA